MVSILTLIQEETKVLWERRLHDVLVAKKSLKHLSKTSPKCILGTPVLKKIDLTFFNYSYVDMSISIFFLFEGQQTLTIH